MLKQKLQEELRQSMLSKHATKTSVLRMLLSAINYYEIRKGAELARRASSPASEADRRGGANYEATNDDVLSVIQKEVKQRKDSIEQFQKGRRQDLVDKETKELELLQKYLPEQLSEQPLIYLITQTIKELGATSMADMGKVMSVVMPKVKGKAEGTIVQKIVREHLCPLS